MKFVSKSENMNIKGLLLRLRILLISIHIHINVRFTKHDGKLYTRHDLFKLCRNVWKRGRQDWEDGSVGKALSMWTRAQISRTHINARAWQAAYNPGAQGSEMTSPEKAGQLEYLNQLLVQGSVRDSISLATMKSDRRQHITLISGLCMHEHQCTHVPSHVCVHTHANVHTHKHTNHTCTHPCKTLQV